MEPSTFVEILVRGECGLSKTVQRENPLVPHKKLRQIYTAMVEARVLDEHIAGLRRKSKARRKLDSIRGQEACRVSTAIELKSSDLISDAQFRASLGPLFGDPLDSLLRFAESAPSKQKRAVVSNEQTIAKRQLPWVENVNDRLKLALGAALAFRTSGQRNIVVVYLYPVEISRELWHEVLKLAATLNLPVILVVLPSQRARKNAGTINICAKARSAGLPGIPVDASDAVALYRVAQEAIGRTRAGDGPVLIECIVPRSTRQRNDETDDPIIHMKNFLVGREICTETWIDQAGNSLRSRLGAPARINESKQQLKFEQLADPILCN